MFYCQILINVSKADNLLTLVDRSFYIDVF